MDFLERARNLLENLKRSSRHLEDIKSDLKTAGPDELTQLYADEFEKIVEISDIFDTLMLVIVKLEEHGDNKFLASRIKAQAESIVGGVENYDIRRDN